MVNKFIFLVVLLLAFCLVCPVNAANIIWVSDAYDERVDSIPDDQGWVDLLVAQGYNVDYTKGASLGNGYWRTLDAAKLARLDAADLIIVSRSTDSGSYDDGAEITQWNSIKTPLILLNVYIARGGAGGSPRWLWVNSESLAGDGGTPTLEALDPHHPIFKGVALDAKNRVDIYDQTVGTGTVSFFNFANMGNGTRIAKPATQDWTMIAEWPAGVVFYPGSTQTPADRRMLFCAGTREGVGFGRGEYNLNAEGVKLFLNIVEYMLGNLVREPWVKAWTPDPADGTQNLTVPLLKWSAGETATMHDVYIGTTATLGPADYRGRQTFTMYFHTPGLTPGATYYWRIDEVEADGVTVHKGDTWSFTAAHLSAHSPEPKNGARWIDVDVDLTWVAGFTAISHDVYFGTNQAVVADGTGGTFKGNQVGRTYDPGTLQTNTTYYWRVDEVEADKTTKHKGDVWSFTTIRPGGGIRGQYYNGTDLSGIVVIDRIDPTIDFNWGAGSPDPALPVDSFSVRWTGELEVPFSETYTFYANTDDGVRLWVADKLIINLWTDRRAPTEAKATIELVGGQQYPIVMEYYQGNPDGDAVAQLSWESPSISRQIIPQAALSLPLRASGPNPANGATNVTDTPTLTWTAGEKAVQHDVYFGADSAVVANATTASTGIYRGRQNLAATSYVPTEAPLVWNKTYYWRIDEVNGVDVWKGSVWSFTTANFIVVDDFEDYTDNVGNRIFQTWKDGLGFSLPAPGYPGNGTGSAVGNSVPPYAEQTVIHGGGQSMPLGYDNGGTGGKARYSETFREWASPQDWTRNNVKALTLWFYGDPNNTAEQLYVALEDNAGHVKAVNYPDTVAVQKAAWQEWNIELSQFSGAGVNLKAIKKMYIGLGNRASPKAGGKGTIFVDDIRVYPSRCVPSKAKPAASFNDDCVVDHLDLQMMAQDWLVPDVAEDVWKGTFSSQDIGAPTAAGSFSFDGSTYTITADGNDIWGTADAFHFAYRQISGDCQITVRVTGLEAVHEWVKAGVMIRDSLNAGSPNAMVAITGGAGNGATFQWRPQADGASSSSRTLTGISPPACVRLVRKGDTLTGYIFLNGKWQQEGQSAVVAMTDPVYIGLAVTSHVAGTLTTATFDRACTFSAAELYADGIVNFKDFAVLADMWLEELLWP